MTPMSVAGGWLNPLSPADLSASVPSSRHVVTLGPPLSAPLGLGVPRVTPRGDFPSAAGSSPAQASSRPRSEDHREPRHIDLGQTQWASRK